MVVYQQGNRRRRSILILIVLTAVALITLDLRESGPISGLQDGARDVVEPISGAVERVFSPVGDWIDGIANSASLSDENDDAPAPPRRAARSTRPGRGRDRRERGAARAARPPVRRGQRRRRGAGGGRCSRELRVHGPDRCRLRSRCGPRHGRGDGRGTGREDLGLVERASECRAATGSDVRGRGAARERRDRVHPWPGRPGDAQAHRHRRPTST